MYPVLRADRAFVLLTRKISPAHRDLWAVGRRADAFHILHKTTVECTLFFYFAASAMNFRKFLFSASRILPYIKLPSINQNIWREKIQISHNQFNRIVHFENELKWFSSNPESTVPSQIIDLFLTPFNNTAVCFRYFES